ncbi:MAG: kelch repeat protein [Monoraphidium minutum]|nr:MAG: kelch repeat protein [Monoraphidium minutum]
MHWTRVEAAGDGPGRRSSHAACAVGDALYVYGGELEPRKPVDDVLYRLQGGEWAKVPGSDGVSPGPRIAAAMASVGSKIYLFGGRTGVEMSEGARDDLLVFDTAAPAPAWSVAPTPAGAPPPPARSYHAAAAAGGRVYIFGGCGAKGRLADLWRYDPAAAAWAELPAAPAGVLPRGGASLVADASGGRLLVMGGFSGKELGDAHTYDIAAGRWLCGDGGAEACGGCASPIPARSVFGAAVHACGGSEDGCGHGGHILLFGGEVDPSTQGHAGAGGFSSEVFCFETDGKGCHALQLSGGEGGAADAPCARGWFAAAAVGGRLMVHGGVDVANARLGDAWQLEH